MAIKRPGYYKTSWNSGEISEEAAGRTEIKSYYSGARRMVRVEPVPQGGFDLMPGTRQVARVRGLLGALSSHAFSLASQPVAAGGVVASCDCGALKTFALADLAALSASASAVVQLEYATSAGGPWAGLGAFTMDATARVWRGGADPGKTLSARYFRIIRVGGSGNVTFAAPADLALLVEVSPALDAPMFSFSIARGQTYDLKMTVGNIDIFRGNTRVASVAVPYTAGQIGRVRAEQRDKTMLLFDADQAPRKILYQSDSDWLFGQQVFKNVPDVDLGGTYTKVNDKWRITVIIAATNVDHINQALLELTVGGETTETISMNNALVGTTERNAIAADIKAKLEALAGVEAGVIVTAEAYTVAYNFTFTIEFAGADNAGTNFSLSGRVSTAVSSTVNASHIQRGDPGGEALMSSGRGYPRDAEFWQQRLVMAGFKAKGSATLLSVLGDYFNLNTEIVSADGAVLVNIDTSSSDRIERLVAARHLLIFAQEAEYFVTDRAISRTTPMNIVQSSRNGCAENVPVCLADDAVFYMNRNNSILYACQYSEVAQAYESTPISLLATHLVGNAVDAAFQRPRSGADAGRYLFARADGLLVSGSIIRGQEITGFVRWVTDGKVKRVMVNGEDDVLLVVEREIDGAPRLIFERMEDGLLFDQTKEITLGAASTTVPGLDDLEGAVVWAMADGYLDGPFVVDAGSITLTDAATHVIVGRWTAPYAETLPPNREVAPNTVLRRAARVHAVEVNVMDTTSLAIGANGRLARDVPLLAFGDAVDVPLAPYTGPRRVGHCPGWSNEPTVVITQVKPGKLKVRDLTIEQGL